jgi:predicted amidohydrolase
MRKRGVIRLAVCQFPTSKHCRRNGRWVRRQMAEAKRKRADVVHFPECALSGYPMAEGFTFRGYDWEKLRVETRAIMELAGKYRQWVVLGSSHRLTGGHKPHNCLYVISPKGKIVDRYDKRFCTGGDLKHYSPGDRFVSFKVNGVKLGLLICYDVRFPEIYREYKKAGVDLMLHSFHNAHGEKRGIWADIMPPSLMCRAATNYMWVSANNPSAYYQQWPSMLIQPDGMVVGKLRQHRAGVLVGTVDTRRKMYDASGPYRRRAMEKLLHSGQLVRDRRSRDRQAL